MIRKVKSKFILLSMVALLVLLAIIVTGMNLINFRAVVNDADDTLTLLSQNKGTFPEMGGEKKNGAGSFRGMSPETPYESRYFSVLLTADEDVIQTDTSKIKAIDSDTAVEYAHQAIDSGKERGFVHDYRYIIKAENERIRLTFLDCGRKLNSFQVSLSASIIMAAAGYVIFFFVLLFFSGRIIRPITESYEKQKRFITDAGHEIKTPLTIIKADVDVLEMDCGENEWLDDIRKQTQRLASLTNDLVYLSRMEEAEDNMAMIQFPFSDVVSETAASFQALAQTQNKNFHCQVQPLLSLNGNEKAIRQLVNILLDNALKYSPAEGEVSLTAEKQGHQLRMTVYNSTTEPIQKDNLHLIFERFYRMDSSRSTQTGGYGIGLSVAKAIVSAHGGKISASSSDGKSLKISVTFPV